MNKPSHTIQAVRNTHIDPVRDVSAVLVGMLKSDVGIMLLLAAIFLVFMLVD